MPDPAIGPPSETLHANERRCADCGRIVSLHRGRWVDRDGRPDRQYQWGVNFCCREHVVALPDGRLRLEAADYHYVAGETQRHWAAP